MIGLEHRDRARSLDGSAGSGAMGGSPFIEAARAAATSDGSTVRSRADPGSAALTATRLARFQEMTCARFDGLRGKQMGQTGPCWTRPTVTRSGCAPDFAASANARAWLARRRRLGGVESLPRLPGSSVGALAARRQEAAEHGWPAPLRTEIPVNSTIPAVAPEQAYDLARTAGCRTAKIKVAERGQTLAEDVARVEAVHDALGPSGKVRVDATEAGASMRPVHAVPELNRFDLEYVEQPCASIDELAELRRRLARSGAERADRRR